MYIIHTPYYLDVFVMSSLLGNEHLQGLPFALTHGHMHEDFIVVGI